MTDEKASVRHSDITAGLARVGLGTGDVVLVHSSLSSFGYVEGGPATVIRALLDTVGPSGTVVVPTFTWGEFHNKPVVTFDVRCTPSETGKITEVFRQDPRAIRSTHICHSVAAIGAHAHDVLGEGRSPFGPGSTFEQLYDLNAWNLLLGVSFGSCTALHAAEERMAVPYRTYRDFAGSTVIQADGACVESQSVEFVRQQDCHNDLPKMGDILASHGVLSVTTIGRATVTNARIRDVIDITADYLAKDPLFLLNDDSRERLERLG